MTFYIIMFLKALDMGIIKAVIALTQLLKRDALAKGVETRQPKESQDKNGSEILQGIRSTQMRLRKRVYLSISTLGLFEYQLIKRCGTGIWLRLIRNTAYRIDK